MDNALLPKVAWIGDAFVEGPVRGLVLRCTALGASINWKTEPEPLELEWAGHGALIVKPYHDPWAWMNRRTRTFLDDFVTTVRAARGLGDDVPLIVVGGSMGGHGALMYTIHAQPRVKACLAICPPCDLTYSYAARNDTPRTLHHAFDCYGDITAPLIEHSPLHQTHRLPDIPYLIVHGMRDVDVLKSAHSDRLVAAMRARRLSVEYREPPLMGHDGALDWATWRRMVDFVVEQMRR